MKEKLLVNAVLQYLNMRGAYAWRQNSGAVSGEYTNKQNITRRRFVQFNGAPGCSDVLGILPGGRAIAAECKIRPNKPTMLQLQFLEHVSSRGGLAIVVYDIDEFVRGIEPHLRGAA